MKVILISIATLCGRISPAGIGSKDDRRHLEKMRAATDASLIGAGTLRAQDPEMRGPAGILDNDRIRAVITRSGNIPFSEKKLFQTGPPPLVFTGNAGAAVLSKVDLEEKSRIIVLPAGPEGLSIGSAIMELSNLGADSVLIEGGGQLNYASLKEGVVDEIFLTIAPCLSGDRNAASFADGHAPLAEPFLALEMISCQTHDTGEIFVSYRVKRER